MKNILSFFFVTCIFFTGLAQQTPTLGLAGYWPFDGNANDLSGNGNHGTVFGATPYFNRFGQANKAYKFDGVANKIVVPHSATIDMDNSSDFTFSVWEKSYPGNLNAALLIKHFPNSWNGYNFIGNSDNAGYCNTPGHIYFYVAAGAFQDACSDNSIMVDSSWHFLTGVYSSSANAVYFYVDGVLQSDIGTTGGTVSNTADLSFGCNVHANDYFFNGVLDDGRIYNRALSQSEILDLFNEGSESAGLTVNNKSAYLNVFPNPAKSFLMIESALDLKSLTISDVTGRIMYEGKITGKQINTDLPAGVYFLRVISSEGSVIQQKIIFE